MEVELREKLEEILLNFADALEPEKATDEVIEDALQEALDAMEVVLMPDFISSDWLITEYEVVKDTHPDISIEDILKRLAESINEKLKSRE